MKVAKKIIIFLISLPIIIIGIILVPLPGPGLLIMLIGLLILSLEFEFARKWVEQMKNQLKKIYDKSLKKYHERLDKIDKM